MNVVIAGARGSGLKAVEIIEAINKCSHTESINLVGFIDDNESLWSTDYFGYPVLGGTETFKEISAEKSLGVICTIGDTAKRRDMIVRLRSELVFFPNLIHPSAQISMHAQIGEGNMFCQNVVVQPGVSIGNYNSFNIGAIIGPLAKIHDYCCVNALVMIASESVVESFCYIGMGAKIKQRLRIERETTIGANAFVNKDTKSESVMVGLPAKPLKRK